VAGVVRDRPLCDLAGAAHGDEVDAVEATGPTEVTHQGAGGIDAGIEIGFSASRREPGIVIWPVASARVLAMAGLATTSTPAYTFPPKFRLLRQRRKRVEVEAGLDEDKIGVALPDRRKPAGDPEMKGGGVPGCPSMDSAGCRSRACPHPAGC
jgi:hypothetical protein